MLSSAIDFLNTTASYETSDYSFPLRTFLLGGTSVLLSIILLQKYKNAKPQSQIETIAEKTETIWQQLEDVKESCRCYKPRISSVNPHLSTIAPNDLMQTANEEWTKKHHNLASKVFTPANFEKHQDGMRREISLWLDENIPFLDRKQLLNCVGLILAKYFISGDYPGLQQMFDLHCFSNYSLWDDRGNFRLDICRTIAKNLAAIESPAEGTFLWHMRKANYPRETEAGVCLSLLIPTTVLADTIRCSLDYAQPFFKDKIKPPLKQDLNKVNLESIRLQNASREFSRFHHEVEIVGENPQDFHPDRYANDAPFLNNWRNAPFVPFGHGPYSCIAIGFCQFLSNLFVEEYLAKLQANKT